MWVGVDWVGGLLAALHRIALRGPWPLDYCTVSLCGRRRCAISFDRVRGLRLSALAVPDYDCRGEWVASMRF